MDQARLARQYNKALHRCSIRRPRSRLFDGSPPGDQRMKNHAQRAGRFLGLRLVAGLWVAVAAASTTLAQTQAQPPAAAPLVISEERKVVRQFDTNGDRRLDLAERKA